MEDGVDAVHGIREVESVGDWGNYCCNAEWAKVTRAELGGRLAGEGEVVSGKADEVANVEGDVAAALVSGGGVADFGCFELLLYRGVDIAKLLV